MSETFRVFHALRIKGFAGASLVAEVASVPLSVAESALAELIKAEYAVFSEARGLFRLTPAGRQAHGVALAADVAAVGTVAELAAPYHDFLQLNTRLKEVCGEWQLRNGEQNDHGDATYDKKVVAKLVALNADVLPVVDKFGAVYPRLATYGPRLDETCQKVADGETKMFTGVMCGSYHDVWMELHEDLILTQGIDRAAEGSF
jgi:hypothetical protein